MGQLAGSFLTLRMLSAFLLGFSSGLPLLLIGGTLKAWLRKDGVDLAVIGFFSWVTWPYYLKFIWAPLMDRFIPPFLDRRRSWILITQVLIAVGLAFLAFQHPAGNLKLVAGTVLVLCFFSASQDIVIDAYRREILFDRELGLGSSMAVNGYRLAMYWAGAASLFIAGFASWKAAYLAMSASMLVTIVATLLSPKVDPSIVPPKSLREAVVEPFKDFFKRRGSVEVLAFILLYKLADQLAGDMLNPFYIDIGFSLVEIGAVSKTMALWTTLVGGVIGGAVILRLGLYRSLWIFGILQASTVALFSVLAHFGHNIPLLAFVVGAECLTSGMGTAAYVGFMASLTNRKFTATQYALLSSFMGLPRMLSGFSGIAAKAMGWKAFFIFCTLTAIPGLLLLLRYHRWAEPESVPQN
jgi:PAT family beta-lactamase induction signal transducer AmpG